MKREKRKERESEFVDADFAEVLFGHESGSLSSIRKAQRKTQQFCRQVQRALNLALSESRGGNDLSDLFVEQVSPAPGCGHLLVHIAVPDGQSVADAMRAIRSDAARLRSEVAMAIARKRAPELSFAPVSPEGGGDE